MLCIFAFGKFSIQAFNYAGQLGWKPQIFVNDVSAAAPLMQLSPARTAEGAVSAVLRALLPRGISPLVASRDVLLDSVVR